MAPGSRAADIHRPDAIEEDLEPASVGASSAAHQWRTADSSGGHSLLTVAVLPGHLAFIEGMATELRLRDPDGQQVGRLSDIGDTAREAAGVVFDTAAAWTEHLGAFYDAEGVRAMLSRDGEPLSRQAISKRRGLLALHTGSRQVVYPAFQFRDGAPLRGLASVLEALPRSLVSRWTVASWLVSPQPDLLGQTPLELLRDGAAEPVVASARSWAMALAA